MKKNTLIKEKANFIGLLLFLLPLSLLANTDHLDEQWLKLLRYNKTLFGYKSEVDYLKYFLAEDGKVNPLSEYEETIKRFNSNYSGDINLHPICTFPGRYKYLQKKQKVKEFDLKKCTNFQYFRKKLQLNSISLIFSSYYINKPASAFGHTFLKLSPNNTEKSDLKSYGIDFSAQVDTNNSLMYGIKGIFGGFFGRFSLLPYFLKLREYNDLESRDLWEFELNFNKKERELFEAHLWDMNLALFDYYYFTENCSYHIYRLIDAIKPEWKLWDKVYSYFVPIDTIIPLLENKEILKNVYVRRSIQKRVHSKLEKLTNKELAFIKKSIKKREVTSLKNIKNKAKVIDSLIEFIDYKYSQDIYLDDKAKINDYKMDILKQRSKLPSTIEEKKKIKTDFLYGHRPRQLKVSYLNSDNLNGFEIEDRTALHNIIEPKGNAYSNFSLEMGKLSFQYNQDNEKFIFNKFILANVTALRPLTYLEKLISWTFSFGIKSDELLRDQFGVFFDFGLGASYEYKRLLISTFVQTYFNEIGREDKLEDKLVGPRLMANLSFERISFQLDYEYLYNLKSNSDEFYSNWSIYSQYNFDSRHGIILTFENKINIEKAQIGYVYYY